MNTVTVHIMPLSGVQTQDSDTNNDRPVSQPVSGSDQSANDNTPYP